MVVNLSASISVKSDKIGDGDAYIYKTDIIEFLVNIVACISDGH